MFQEKMIFRLFFSLVIFTFASGNNSAVVKMLSERVSDSQIKQTQQYANITQLEKLEGMYPNYIRFNLRGSMENAVIRRDVGLFDNSPFVSCYVGLQILDAYRFGNAPMPSHEDIQRIVKVNKVFHEMRYDYNTSLTAFYPQRYDSDKDLWIRYPTNIIEAVQELEKLPASYSKAFANILKISTESIDMPASLLNVDGIVNEMQSSSDFDDSILNLCFGSFLFQMKDTYPDAWAAWNNDNQNLTSIFDALKLYAYRPFSSDRSVNTIDTRTYYFIRGFLDKAKNDNKDVALIPTWVLSIDEQLAFHRNGIFESFIFGSNDMCMGIVANVLSSTISALYGGLIDPQVVNDDDDLNLIFESSASLMVYWLQNNLTDRPDLSLLYYPSLMQVYWLVSRGLLYMENANLKGSLKDVPVFHRYYIGLSEVMRMEVTNDILSRKKVDQDGTMFLDGFLGTDDLSYNQETIIRGEDRYYITAMAANALIYTWSVYDGNGGGLRWLDSVPDDVVTTVHGLSKWLEKYPFGGSFGVSNAVFGAITRNIEALPYWYPANRFEYFNGTDVGGFESPAPKEQTVFGMEGYVTPDEYRQLLDVDQFGEETPLEFYGFNSGRGTWLFWSCDAISYAGAMMTLSMTQTLEESGTQN